MNTIRSRLGLKLFLSYLAVILVGMAALGVTARFTSPRAFERHMLAHGAYFGMGPRMMPGSEGMGRGMMAEVYADFRASFNEALIWAALAAIGVAMLASILFSRSIVAPVRAMMSASQRIAGGHYEERVQKHSSDELGQLAGSFNQMAERLEGVEAMRRQLIGDVAHELRTPLAAIQGSMEGLMDGVLPAGVETYEQIHTEATRLSRLVDDLQELSRVEAHAYELDLRPLAVDALIRTVIKRLDPQFDEKRVTLTTNLPPEPIQVLADEDRIIQVLTNLVGNALQHTPKGGQVTISSERMDSQA